MQNWRQNLALDLNQWFTYACRCLKIYLSDEYTSQFLEKKNTYWSVQTNDFSWY